MIQCSECPAEYHVSCAWKQAHKFGFEMQQVHPSPSSSLRRPLTFGSTTRRRRRRCGLQAKSSRREAHPTVEFKGTTGVMVPSVICKGHVGHKRQLHDICEMTDSGEVRQLSLPSSLRTAGFCVHGVHVHVPDQFSSHPSISPTRAAC